MIIKVDSDIELRQLELSDSINIFKTIDNQRKYLGKWLPFVANTKKLKDTENFVNSAINIPKDKFEYIFTIRKQSEFVGVIGFQNTDKLNKKTEMGYWLSEEFQGKGIITKSVEKLCDFAFKEQDINRIQIKCAVDNKPSIKIPKKLGFKYEGTQRHGGLLAGNIFADLEIYSKLKSD